MCGIAGVIDKDLIDKKAAIESMTESIHHRGPDDEGFFIDEFVGLGMRRLAIIDLATGKQPIFSEDGRFLIFFNGEIYNYRKLREELEEAGRTFQTESDTEVILAMFEAYGARMLSRLRGMFAFVIYDIVEKKVFLARDFFGIKPLYYLTSKTNTITAFSSEIKSFFAIPGWKPEVNDAAVYNYLSFQYNPLEETFFKNVWKLPPAHSLSIDLKTGEVEQKRYWQFQFKQDESLDEEKTKIKIAKTFEDSVLHHMIADVPVGSFLSGGIDSSIIATLMQNHLEAKLPSAKVKTFTVGFTSLSEGAEAKETAEPLGTDHTEITIGAEEYFEALPKAIWHFDEPVADPSALGLYFLAREARKHVKVVLSGEGADELFGGYNIYLEPFARYWISWLPKFILKSLASLPLRGSNERNIGKAACMEQGVREAKNDLLFFCDADLSGFKAEYAEAIIAPVRRGTYDMFIGTRSNLMQRSVKAWALNSGERALRKKVWDAILPFYKHRYRIEAGLNHYVREHTAHGFSWRMFAYSQPFKEVKYGVVRGTFLRWWMNLDVAVAYLRNMWQR